MDEEGDDEDKTEDPTPKRLEKLREDGVVPRSADVGPAVALVLGLLVVGRTIGTVGFSVWSFAQRIFSLRDAHNPILALSRATRLFVEAVLPLAVVLAVATLVVGVAQTRGYVAFDQVAPKFERLDPMKGLMRLVPSREMALEMAKMTAKVLVLGVVAWIVVHGSIPRLVLLARMPTQVALGEVADVGSTLLFRAAVAFGVLAAIDYGVAYRKFMSQARMTKQEIKDEHKEQEGDPKVKAKRRARAIKLAKSRAVSDVKQATVLITNPTHLSIALRFIPGKDPAPIVIAKGEDDTAMKMREVARQHRIPIVENRPLARALYAACKVGQFIPVELYEAAAHIIAHVMSLSRR